MAILQKKPRLRDELADGHDYAAAEIDLDEFEKARRDPDWKRFVDAAKARRQQLRREGRSA